MCRVLSQPECRDHWQGCRGDENLKLNQQLQTPVPAAWYGLVPIVFTTSGGMGEQSQRRYWNPHWIRVAEEDEAMKIGPWVTVARKRKAFWEARFAVAVANCNASMISRSQHITD
jgi:hypothetical protein